jgi:hypothetical protein
MRRAAYWLIPIIAFGVALFIALFLVQINPPAPKVHSMNDGEGSHVSKGLTEQMGSWISRLSGNSENDYFYPVNEVTLHLDMGGAPNDGEIYRLTIKPKNPDEVLRIKEALEKSELPYNMENDGEQKFFIIDSNDKAQLQSLVTKLKNYQNTATMSPNTEEK